jgi:hypothetical protein
MESQVKDLHKIQTIIEADYSEYPNPLRELLEYRKEAYIRTKKIESKEDLGSIIEYCEKQIKLILAL